MTVKKAIDVADMRLPGNGYSREEKLNWLSSLEVMWAKFRRCLGYDAEDVKLTDEDGERELSVEAPFEEIYIMWLLMKMHYYNGEIELYNNSAEAFNTSFEEAKKSFLRENQPKKSHSFHGHREV